MAMAKAVASATAALVMAAKEVSDVSEGQANQSRVIDSARQCGLATSQLVACTKVLAPTIAASPECQEQFADAAKQVASFVDDVVETAEVSCGLLKYTRLISEYLRGESFVTKPHTNVLYTLLWVT